MLLYKHSHQTLKINNDVIIKYPAREGEKIINTIDQKEEEKILELKDIESIEVVEYSVPIP